MNPLNVGQLATYATKGLTSSHFLRFFDLPVDYITYRVCRQNCTTTKIAISEH